MANRSRRLPRLALDAAVPATWFTWSWEAGSVRLLSRPPGVQVLAGLPGDILLTRVCLSKPVFDVLGIETFPQVGADPQCLCTALASRFKRLSLL